MFLFDQLLNRRHFLHHLACASAAYLPAFHMAQRLLAQPTKPNQDPGGVILLWMGGGPTHIDTWDPKPGHQNHFTDLKALDTPVPGMRFGQHLEKMVNFAKDIVIFHGTGNEGDHRRGSVVNQTGRKIDPILDAQGMEPHVGAKIAFTYREADKDKSIPTFMSMGGTATGSGFLGNNFAPFQNQSPGTIPSFFKAPPSMGQGDEGVERLHRRKRLFYAIEDKFTAEQYPGLTQPERDKILDASKAHSDVYGKAWKLTTSAAEKVFQFNAVEQRLLQDKYGNNGVGRAFLQARKAIEAGARFVQADVGGWDMHQNTVQALSQRVPPLDQAMAALIEDLKSSGLFKTTVVAWIGDFGRTPKINQNAGRDHWPRNTVMVAAGGKLKGGQVFGDSGPGGDDIKGERITIANFYATIWKAIGLENLSIRDQLGRPAYAIHDIDDRSKPAAPVAGAI